MRRPFYRATENEDIVIDLTPMLDMVFIMLIFFVITSSPGGKETGIDIRRPAAQSGVAKEAANLRVVINEYDEILVDKRRVDVRALRPELERMHLQSPQSGLIIHADKKSTSNRLVQVMDAARLVGIDAVSIATIEQ